MSKISIIMPVYNSKEYLENAIESVLKQNFIDFELILVDDGSSDGSEDVCDKYADLDKRVVVLHKENGGICSARNKGLSVAKGKYIMFIDNDDEYIGDNVFKAVYLAAEENCADWVRFSRLRTTIDGKKIVDDIVGVHGIVKAGEKPLILTREECFKKYWIIKMSGALNGVWNALYSSKLIQEGGLRFDETIHCGGEDWKFNLQYLNLCQNVFFMEDAFYHYYRRTVHSISTKYNYNRIESILWVAEEDRKMLIQNPIIELSDSLIIEKILNQYQRECAVVMSHPHCNLDRKSKKKVLSNIERIFDVHQTSINKYISLFKRDKKRAIKCIMSRKCPDLYLMVIKIYSKMNSVF